MEIIKKDDSKKVQKLSKIDLIEKEKLKRLYIDEGKTLIEISRFYGFNRCDKIKSKLNKYGISIRPHGAFLVDSDGESLYSKFCKGEISSIDYENARSIKKGYENRKDYYNDTNHKSGKCLSMSENKECSTYLGIHIAERILPLIFNNVERMLGGNPGYDFICSNGYKIDVKSSSITNKNQWMFAIKKNKIADYFLLIAFDNRNDLKIIHIWLVKSDDVIKGGYLTCKLNERYSFSISIKDNFLKKLKKYEITDKLKEIQKICDDFKKKDVVM